MRHFSWLWCYRIAFYIAVIGGCYLAFGPANVGLQAHWNDKLQHFVGFVVMAILAHLAHPKASYLAIFTGLALFGLAIECVQAYLPHRQFSWWDWLADVLGVLLYLSVLLISARVPFKKRIASPD
ncbi:MAG: VanZ family protein [Oleiphilaceae bacterium]|nr:VanZ family protein [Oleiphilaceae bacterium]